MRRNTTTWGMVAASGVLALTLAACGNDSPEVEEPTTDTTSEQGTDESDDAGTETEGDDAGTDEGTETEGDDAGTDEGDDAGTDEGDDEGTDEGTQGGDAAAGEQIDPSDFVAQLKSPGMENLTTFTMNMDMEMEGQAVTMSGTADLGGSSPAMDIVMEMPGMGSINMIMVDGSAYMSMPGLTEEGQFIQMPLEEVMGEDADEFTNQVDMTSQWDDWEAGAQSVTFIGPEDVNGETLNKYELLLDTSSLDTEDAAGMPDEVTYHVWLDDQNYMRQVEINLMGAESLITMDNWGEPVDITAPTNITEMPGMPTSP